MKTSLVPLACVAALALARPSPAAAQFTDPCELTCVGVLGATSFVAATGVSIAVGRIGGGMSTVNEGLLAWGASFAALTASAMALSGDGGRQERAVYAAGIGTLGGAVLGLGIEGIRTDGDEPHVLAGTLIGAALGAVAAGAYGALSYHDGGSGEAIPALSVTIPF